MDWYFKLIFHKHFSSFFNSTYRFVPFKCRLQLQSMSTEPSGIGKNIWIVLGFNMKQNLYSYVMKLLAEMAFVRATI